LCGLEFPSDGNLLVGLESADDAGVYQISDEIALIQTVDFFTPIVDDPYWFGQIAAANALSDVYAMGGVPRTAMNLVAFPLKQMDMSVLRSIIQGGLDKMKEAEVVLVGGHSIEDNELKYGLSVTGIAHPRRILTKQNVRAGDQLILTKPLGTGVINTAIKGGLAEPETVDEVTRLMATLNRKAAEVVSGFPVRGCTDITGFGLLGHLAEMIVGKGVGARLSVDAIPLIRMAVEYAGMGLLPAGAYNNRKFRIHLIDADDSVDPLMVDILFDPQTSGGLLIPVEEKSADSLVAALRDEGVTHASIIGKIVEGPEEKIYIEK